MRAFDFILFILFTATLISCGGENPRPVFVEEEPLSEDVDDTITPQAGDEIIVPFRSEGGVKYVQVKVNGVGLEMVLDTGCSTTMISMAEANYLYQKGKLTNDDILGTAPSCIADGSIVEDMVVNLREVIIDGQIRCTDVQAVVSDNMNAPLLLGNEVLDRLATVQINNEDETILFTLK